MKTTIKCVIGGLSGLIAVFVLLLILSHGYLQLSDTSYWILWDSTGTMVPFGYETIEVKDRGFVDHIDERTLKFDQEGYNTLVDRIKETKLYRLDTTSIDEINAMRKNKAPGYWTKTDNGQRFVDSSLIGEVRLSEIRIEVQLVDSTRTLYFKRGSF